MTGTQRREKKMTYYVFEEYGDAKIGKWTADSRQHLITKIDAMISDKPAFLKRYNNFAHMVACSHLVAKKFRQQFDCQSLRSEGFIGPGDADKNTEYFLKYNYGAQRWSYGPCNSGFKDGDADWINQEMGYWPNAYFDLAGYIRVKICRTDDAARLACWGLTREHNAYHDMLTELMIDNDGRSPHDIKNPNGDLDHGDWD